MNEVTEDQFYAAIGPLDVVSNVVGDFPYTTEFKMRYGPLMGKAVDRLGVCDEDRIVTTYYLAK